MAVGPISPLAFSGKPLFFTAFTDPEQLLRENRLGAPGASAPIPAVVPLGFPACRLKPELPC